MVAFAVVAFEAVVFDVAALTVVAFAMAVEVVWIIFHISYSPLYAAVPSYLPELPPPPPWPLPPEVFTPTSRRTEDPAPALKHGIRMTRSLPFEGGAYKIVFTKLDYKK